MDIEDRGMNSKFLFRFIQILDDMDLCDTKVDWDYIILMPLIKRINARLNWIHELSNPRTPKATHCCKEKTDNTDFIETKRVQCFDAFQKR